MVNIVGYNIELMWHVLGALILRLHFIYQPTILSLRGPNFRLQYYYWIELSVHCTIIYLTSEKYLFEVSTCSIKAVVTHQHLPAINTSIFFKQQ